MWWLGENQASVSRCTHAYSLFRRAGDVGSAVHCAVWLSITYKANFANFAAAGGWIGRAERLLEPLEPGPLHGWTWLARAYRMADLDAAEEVTVRAVDLAGRPVTRISSSSPCPSSGSSGSARDRPAWASP